MTEKQESATANRTPTNDSEQRKPSAEEARVLAALAQARQNVKRIVKKEREAEVASAELLNLRLKDA
jgi:hypothetical protein